MGDLYKETLYTEGSIWGGHTRDSIIENIKDGLAYLTTTDLVDMHAEISTIQLRRAEIRENQDPELKQYIHNVQK